MKHLILLVLTAAILVTSRVSVTGLPWVYSTYLGSESEDQGAGVAVDSQGQATVTGFTSGTSFPAETGSGAPQHGVDAFVTRFTADGTAAHFTYWFNALTLFAEDEGYSIALDTQGNAYITGYTRSEDFCTVFGTVPGYHPTYFGETDAFVLKIHADGSGLAYCTFLGGTDWDIGRAITVDANGNVLVVGGTWSTDFPTTPGAVQPALADLRDTFLAKLNASGTTLLYSTFLGGAGQDEAVGVALATDGVVHVTGWTNSADFPVTAGVVGPSYRGSTDGFHYQLDLAANQLVSSTYLGGSDEDRPAGLVVVGHQPIVTGATRSTDFPTTPAALATTLHGGQDGFVARLASDGRTLDFSTYLGGREDDWAWAVDAGHDGTLFVAGATASPDFPITPGAVSASLRGERDATLARLSADGSYLVYSTYLGGSDTDQARGVAVDAAGDVVLTGSTTSADFPTTPSAFDTTYNGGGDSFVTQLRLDIVPPASYRTYLPMLRRP